MTDETSKNEKTFVQLKKQWTWSMGRPQNGREQPLPAVLLREGWISEYIKNSKNKRHKKQPKSNTNPKQTTSATKTMKINDPLKNEPGN